MIRRILCLTLLVATVGCSPVSSSWTCKTNLKGTCNSIWEIDNGQKGENRNSINLKNDFEQKVYKTNITNFSEFRSKESVARVVFLPYVDEAGNRHDISVVYYLEQKSEWRE